MTREADERMTTPTASTDGFQALARTAASDVPDFNQMAHRMIELVKVLSVDEIAAQLRLVWNARGAADLAAIKEAAFTRDLNTAIRSLDEVDPHAADPGTPRT